MAPLLWFAAAFVPLVFVRRWLNRHLVGLAMLLGADEQATMVVQFLLFLPGVVLHEVSHWLAARVLGVRTGRMSIWPKRQGKGMVRMGAVQVRQTDVLRSALIGLAPFVLASVAVVLIGRFALGTDPLRQAVADGRWQAVPRLFAAAVRGADALFWVYMVFAISNSMFPSESDRSAWRPVAVYIAVAAAVLYIGGVGPVLGGAGSLLAWVANSLTYAMVVTLVVDLLSVLIIGILELVGGRIRGRRMVYH